MENKEDKIVKFVKFSLIIILILTFFSFIGTCSNRANINNRLEALSSKIDSIAIENVKLENALINKINLELSSKIETNAIQFFLYKDALDRKELTIIDLKNKLKKLQKNNRQSNDKNIDTKVIK